MDETTNTAPASKSKTPMIAAAVVALLLIGGGIWYVAGQQSQQSSMEEEQSMQQQTPANTDGTTNTTDQGAMQQQETSDTQGAQGEVKTFNVSASNFKFSTNEIRVKQGDTVRIVLTDDQGFHDFVIDEFDVRSKQLQAGQSETLEFVADQAGTFEFYCSVGTHRQMGMKGNLIVE